MRAMKRHKVADDKQKEQKEHTETAQGMKKAKPSVGK